MKKRGKQKLFGTFSKEKFDLNAYPISLRKELLIKSFLNIHGVPTVTVSRKKKSRKRLKKADYLALKKELRSKRKDKLVSDSFNELKPENPKRHTQKNKLNPKNGLPLSSGYETNRSRY